MGSVGRSCALLQASVAFLEGLSAGHAQSPKADRAAEVNPFIGTANGGNVFPGATTPFGMVQFSPEATPPNPKRMIAAPGGYEYGATHLRGFSLTNVEGWSCAGGSGDVPLCRPRTRSTCLLQRTFGQPTPLRLATQTRGPFPALTRCGSMTALRSGWLRANDLGSRRLSFLSAKQPAFLCGPPTRRQDRLQPLRASIPQPEPSRAL